MHAAPEAPDRRWVVLGALLVGTFSVSLSLSLLFSATPRIMSDLGADISQVAWVSVAYALGFTVLQPVFGHLADLYGRKRFFVGGLALFTLGAALAALSWDVLSMAAFRFLQGVGSAAVFPVGMAYIGQMFAPEERGKAMGVWGIAGGSAPAIGPTLGGIILDASGWRAIYWFSVAIGLVSLLVPLRLLRESSRPTHGSTDYAGSAALFVGVGSLLLAISQGRAWGWTSAPTLGLVALALVGFVMLAAIERRSSSPVIDLVLAGNATFAAAALVAFISFAALQGTLFLLPFFLMQIHGYGGGEVGLLLLPFFLPMAAASPVAGLLTDRIGTWTTALLGMTLATVALGLFSRLDEQTPYWTVAAIALVLGLGIATALPPLGKVVMGLVPRIKMASASGLFSMARSLGGPFGVAIFASVVAERTAYHARSIIAERVAALGIDSALLRDLPRLRELAQQGAVRTDVLRSLQEMQDYARVHALVAAFTEAFLIAATLSALGVVVTLFVRQTRPRGGAASPGRGRAAYEERDRQGDQGQDNADLERARERGRQSLPQRQQ